MSTNNADLELNKLFDVKNKVALITGGGSGIGLMIAQALAVNGAKAYIIGRNTDKLETAVKAHGQGISGQIVPIVADITSKKEIASLVEKVESQEASLDILVNNAGVALSKQAPKGTTGPEMKAALFDPESASFEDWSDTYSTNVTQLYMTTTAFLPLLEKSTERHPGWSSTVINITSISGLVLKSQGHFAYNASKGAAIHLTKMLASEISNHGIKVRINSIAPGVFPSEMTTGGQSSDETMKSQLEKEKYAHLPARRPGNDVDMANAFLFMATNQYLNGQTVPVDGGYLLKFGQ